MWSIYVTTVAVVFTDLQLSISLSKVCNHDSVKEVIMTLDVNKY